jgi:hypothetical protein
MELLNIRAVVAVASGKLLTAPTAGNTNTQERNRCHTFVASQQ